MMHVAAEQIQPGDIVVAAITAECTDGYFGDLLATSFQARGARPHHRRRCARREDAAGDELPGVEQVHLQQGHHQGNPGLGEHPVVCAGMLVTPGDVIVADDDGIVVRARCPGGTDAGSRAKARAWKAKSAPSWPVACWGWTCTRCASHWKRRACATSTDLSVCKQFQVKGL